jgi:hypothetical protein
VYIGLFMIYSFCFKVSSVFVGFEVFMVVVMKSSVIWYVMLCSPLKVSWCFRGMCCLSLQGQVSQTKNHLESLPSAFMLVSCLGYSLTLNMQAMCPFEMLFDSHQITWHCVPEGRPLHNLYTCVL